MPKTIKLRLSDDSYTRFSRAAEHDNRTVSNLIETLALMKLDEEIFCDKFEMQEITGNKSLLKKLARGHTQAARVKGKLVAARVHDHR